MSKEAFKRRVKLAETFQGTKHETSEHRAILYAHQQIKDLKLELKKYGSCKVST